MTLEELFAIPPYSLNQQQKNEILKEILSRLTHFHYKNCIEYKKILDALNYDITHSIDVSELPFIPVRLFKTYTLKSVPQEKIVKTLTSSGTSGQAVSKILLDAENVHNQTKTLNEIIKKQLMEYEHVFLESMKSSKVPVEKIVVELFDEKKQNSDNHMSPMLCHLDFKV